MATLSTTFATFSSQTRSGSDSISWNNPSNAQSADSTFATLASTPTGAGYTNYLVATNLTSKLPGNAVINGITVTVKRTDAQGTATDSDLRIIQSSTIQGTNKASATAWPTTNTAATYGSATDQWGLSLTADQLNDSSFGIVLSVNIADSGVVTGGGGIG